MAWSQSAAKLYRALLFAYPAEFRNEYGPEMERMFQDRLRSEPRLRLWLDTFADVALGAPKEHAHILLADLRYGLRSLKKSPGFTAVALLVLALGIGATTAVFSLVDSVLLRSLPYREVNRLMYVWTPNTRWKGAMLPQEMAPSDPDFVEWQRLNHSFSSLTMLNEQTFNFVHGNGVSRIAGASVPSNFFATLDVHPQFGRLFDAHDDRPGQGHVALISDSLSRGEFGGDRSALGKTLQLNRQKYTIVGVMPPDFGFPYEGDVPYTMANFNKTEVWVPAALTAKQKTDRNDFSSSDAVIGRLRPGVSIAQAQAEMASIESHLDILYPEQWKGWTALVKPMLETVVGPVRPMLSILLGAVLLVLLIACSNIAGLLLARSTARTQELGIRAALGAERARLIRQLLTEALLLASLGGALGVAFAYLGVKAVVFLNPGNIPRFSETALNGPVLLAGLILSLLAGFLFGIAPALIASRPDINHLLRSAGNKGSVGTSNRWRHALIVTEVALCIVLLTGAGLLIRSYLQLQAVPTGFAPSSVTMNLSLDDRYAKPEQRGAFFRRFLDELHGIPGVLRTGASSNLPFDGSESVSFVDIKGYGKLKEVVETRNATPGYFEALGVPVLTGRGFTGHDITDTGINAVIVNESFAKAYLPGVNPLGRQIRQGMGDFSGVPWATIVGVIADIRQSKPEEKAQPQVYGPYWPSNESEARIVVRTAGPPEQVIAGVRQLLHRLDPALALQDVHTMSERIQQANSKRRFQTVLLTTFAGLALVLALAGLYGLLAYAVRQRTAEMGLRMALGATRLHVLSMVMRQGLTLVGAGLLIGVVASLLLTRLVSGWLYGVTATDPITYTTVIAFIAVVAGCACLIPALQATSIDPKEALRYE